VVCAFFSGGVTAQSAIRSYLKGGLALKGGPVFKAHRLLYPSTLGLRVIKKKTVRV